MTEHIIQGSFAVFVWFCVLLGWNTGTDADEPTVLALSSFRLCPLGDFSHYY